jgi:hypothetical protein
VIPVSSFAMAAELAPADATEVVVAFPIVRDSWCRAHLKRSDGGWQEQSVREMTQAEATAEQSGIPLIVPWGEHARATVPPDTWDPARHVFSCAARAQTEPPYANRPVRVRYLGPSQAERNFRARRHQDPQRRDP